MKKLLLILLLLSPLGLSSNSQAACTPGTNWTVSWTDAFGQTAYQLSAPCKVFIGIPFDIVATVTDSSFPNSSVAFSWSLLDNGAVIAGGDGSWLTLSAGQWQKVYTRTYSGSPIDHTLEFAFTDLGQGAGAHQYASRLIGSLTVDPVPVFLSVSLAGSGGGSVHGDTGGISCSNGSSVGCSAPVGVGSQVVLSATPDWRSLFTGWTGDCSGSGDCTVTLDTDRSATATFTPNIQVRIPGPQPAGFATLQDAYNASADGAVIQAQVYTFLEDLLLDRDNGVVLSGGMDGNYAEAAGYTTVGGSLTVGHGTLSVSNIILR